MKTTDHTRTKAAARRLLLPSAACLLLLSSPSVRAQDGTAPPEAAAAESVPGGASLRDRQEAALSEFETAAVALLCTPETVRLQNAARSVAQELERVTTGATVLRDLDAALMADLQERLAAVSASDPELTRELELHVAAQYAEAMMDIGADLSAAEEVAPQLLSALRSIEARLTVHGATCGLDVRAERLGVAGEFAAEGLDVPELSEEARASAEALLRRAHGEAGGVDASTQPSESEAEPALEPASGPKPATEPGSVADAATTASPAAAAP